MGRANSAISPRLAIRREVSGFVWGVVVEAHLARLTVAGHRGARSEQRNRDIEAISTTVAVRSV